jgi:hypothetical protein
MLLPRQSYLRTLPGAFRLGIFFILLVLGGGFLASARHLYNHDHKRDERPGLTVDDVKGVYHGIKTRAPMLVALESGHPEGMPQADRDDLLKWLNGDKLRDDYDNLDLGDRAPAELITKNCISCHARSASDPVAKKMPLEFLDDVMAVSVSRNVTPNSVEIITNSTHTHAISLATLSLTLCGLVALTRFRGGFIGIVAALHGLGLLGDIGGWWLTILHPDFAIMIMICGGIYFLTTATLSIAIALDLLLKQRGPGEG